MPSQKNLDQVQKLQQEIDKAQAVYLIDYHGLDANTLNNLRNRVREQGGKIQVTKNTLFTIALRQSEQSLRIIKNQIAQSSAAVYAYEDAITPLKALVEFAKTNDDKLPKLKIGFYQQQILDEVKLQQLSDLPGIDTLRGQVVGMLNSPIQRLVGSLNGNLSKLVIALSEIQKQKAN